MPPRSSKVKVYVRTRPTNDFASDMISLGRDNRVSLSNIIIQNIDHNHLNRQLAFIERHQQVWSITRSTIGHSI